MLFFAKCAPSWYRVHKDFPYARGKKWFWSRILMYPVHKDFNGKNFGEIFFHKSQQVQQKTVGELRNKPLRGPSAVISRTTF